MTTKNKIHDKFYKETMSDLRIARDFFSLHLPEKIKKQVDLETLQIEKTDFITKRHIQEMFLHLFMVSELRRLEDHLEV